MLRTRTIAGLAIGAAAVVVGLIVAYPVSIVVTTVMRQSGIATPGLYDEVEATSAELNPGSAGTITYEENYGTGPNPPRHTVVISGADAYENVQQSLVHAGFSRQNGDDERETWRRDNGPGYYTYVDIRHVDAGTPFRIGDDRLTIEAESVIVEVFD